MKTRFQFKIKTSEEVVKEGSIVQANVASNTALAVVTGIGGGKNPKAGILLGGTMPMELPMKDLQAVDCTFTNKKSALVFNNMNQENRPSDKAVQAILTGQLQDGEPVDFKSSRWFTNLATNESVELNDWQNPQEYAKDQGLEKGKWQTAFHPALKEGRWSIFSVPGSFQYYERSNEAPNQFLPEGLPKNSPVIIAEKIMEDARAFFLMKTNREPTIALISEKQVYY